jgi:membrane-associated phospholipid phosphatase
VSLFHRSLDATGSAAVLGAGRSRRYGLPMPFPKRRKARADSKPGLAPPWAVAVAVAAFSAGTAITALVWHSGQPDPFDAWVMRGQEVAYIHANRVADVVSGTVAPVVIVVMLTSAALAWLVRRWDVVVLALMAIPGTLGVEVLLKQLVHRQRPGGPDLVYPSGHLAVATAAAVTLVLVLRVTPVPPRTRIVVALLAGSYVLVTATARLVETVHFLTDVLGGVAAGIVLTLAAALAITAWSQERRIRDSPAGPPRKDHY